MDQHHVPLSIPLIALLFLILWHGPLLGQSPPPANLPTPDELNLTVLSSGDEIVLDGQLDEDVWKQADVVDQFWQRAPQDRAPASEKTEVRVLQDEQYIFTYKRRAAKILFQVARNGQDQTLPIRNIAEIFDKLLGVEMKHKVEGAIRA